MANWRDEILKHFQPKISRLTLVADPDGLLTEEGMLSAIRDRGFELIPFDDTLAFRYAYESQYRSQWDQGLKTDLVVLLRSTDQQLGKLPFDLLKAGRQLTFALHLLFPKLNYAVVAGLDRAYLDAIDEAYRTHDGAPLTERETRDFVLMHCYRIVPKLIKTPADLLKSLLSLHTRRVRLPDMLNDHLLESLGKDAMFAEWPLTEIIPNRDKFLRFLHEEWNLFLASFGDRGPQSRIPFEHDDVRAYTDTLFLDGSLTPVKRENVADLPAWARTGVVHDAKADNLRRFRALSKRFGDGLPGAESSHREWQQAARDWAELVVLRWLWYDSLDDGDLSVWTTLHANVEDVFGQWMVARYASLHNLPFHQQPVMVHQIAHFLAVERGRRKLGKIALLVMDGLALDQWVILRKGLEDYDAGWRFEEGTAFAWVPTLTSVTRQSIFAAEPPLFFPNSLETTSRERAHWQRFWEDHGVPRTEVELVTNVDGVGDPRVNAVLDNHRLSVLGLVWNKVDDVMHGMQMQTAGMHNQVRLWSCQGHLQRLLVRLWHEGFTIFLTADHGNVTATGIGTPREGVLAETKGQRVRVYDRPEFLDEVAKKFPASLRWPNHGLPPSRHVLLAGNLKAFVNEGDEIVGHGGIALEEVIVPFVGIAREGT